MNVFLLTPGTTASVWIGGREAPAARDNVWVWDQALWAADEPSNGLGIQHHLSLYPGELGLDDDDQFKPLFFLCETEYLRC